MFVHKEQLEYILATKDYRSVEQYEAELEKLFVPGWHIVGMTTELPNDGDFKTLELLGRPIQIRKADGQFHAMLNVCSHRHCLLTNELKGNSPQIRCQYHGWEYSSSGRVSKVPDGQCFKPFDRENSKLQVFRTATAGQLIFVSLTEGPSLEEYLGDIYERVANSFQHPWKFNWYYTNDFDCNWKIPVENTVETYHLPYIHPQTLGGFGLLPEEAQTHELEDHYTRLVYELNPDEKKTRQQQWVVGNLGGTKSTDEYIHHHRYPNLVFTFSDLYIYAQVYLPTSPTTCHTEAWMFSLNGEKRSPWARGLAYLIARRGRKVNAAIQREDASVFVAQQQGMASSPHPGCIGTREERIYAFHRYIDRKTREPG